MKMNKYKNKKHSQMKTAKTEASVIRCSFAA